MMDYTLGVHRADYNSPDNVQISANMILLIRRPEHFKQRLLLRPHLTNTTIQRSWIEISPNPGIGIFAIHITLTNSLCMTERP